MSSKEIKLKEKEAKSIAGMLNDYLASYHIHYQKLRGCHWNIKGQNFFTLHLKFEELYSNAQLTIDEIAERVLTLGNSPYSRFSDYIKIATIEEINTVKMSDMDMVAEILNDMTKLIEMERSLMETSAAAGDDGTNDMVNRFMQFKEKNVWMLNAFIGKK